MCIFRYILPIIGLLKMTLYKVKIKDIMLTSMIASSKNVSQGIAVIYIKRLLKNPQTPKINFYVTEI